MQALSWLAAYWRVPFYALAVLAVAMNHRCKGDAPAAQRWLRAGLSMALALPVSVALTWALKEMVAAPRPLSLLGVEAVRVFDAADSAFSFPSGHSASAALVATSLWVVLPSWFRALALVLCVAVGVSRIWLGMHFPSDVLAGFASGAGVAAASAFLMRRATR